MSVPKTREEIYAELKRRISTRTPGYEPGKKLPTQDVLAEEFGVHRVTVSKVVGDLVREGLLVSQRRQGTWVPDEVSE